MHDPSKTNQRLREEITVLKRRIQELEQTESKRKLTEEKLRNSLKALKESEIEYRTVFDYIGDAIAIHDMKGRILDANRVLCERLGYSREELLRMTPMDIDAPEYAELVPDRILQLRTKGSHIFETCHLRKDGTSIPTEINCRLIDYAGQQAILSVGRDITKRKQMEVALGGSEEKYRTIIEQFSEGLVLVDDNGNISDWNRAHEEISGIKRADVIGQPYWEVMKRFAVPENRTAEWIERVKQATLEMISTGQSPQVGWNIETKIIRADGEQRYIAQSVFPVKTATSFWIGLMVRDITRRKRAEEALRESEDLFRLLFNTINDAVFLHYGPDAEGFPGRFIAVNDIACERLGYSRDELLTMSPPDIDAPDTVKAIPRMMEKLNKEKQAIWEGAHVTGHGRRIPVEINNRLINFKGIPAILSTARDITDRKRAEEALIEQLKFLQVLIDTIPIPVFFKDTKGIYLGCNKSCEIFFGPRDQLLGKTVYDVSPKDIADIYYLADQELFNNPGIQIYETLAADKTGLRHNVIFHKATYLDKNGNLAGLIGAIYDLTDRKKAEEDRKQLEERLQRSEKMEALGLLSGGVAHDLNNVLGILIGYSELLLNKIEESSPVRSYATNIMGASERAAAIIQDMLTLARRGVQSQEVVNLNNLIMAFLKTPEFEKLSAFHPNIKVMANLETEPLHIIGSPVQIGKTIMNLVSNAAEAMPEGGLVTITTSNQYLDRPVKGYDEVSPGDYVVLAVSDSGEGISANDIKHIFEPFYTKKVMGKSGTGLGLAVVWGTVKDHNGYIDVQTVEGKGSTFTLYFPVTREKIKIENIKIPISEYMGHGETILVVDDVQGQRDLASEMLRQLNYIVDIASSGEDAVAYLKDHTVDLLLLDMIMDPGMDGLDTYRNVLEIHPNQKAIIVSGFSETDKVKLAQELGAGAFVKKPYVSEKLGVAIRKELERK
jgi:PAS domain S-box-containing protein